MNPNEFGRRLGIGVRVAGRLAQQRAADAAQAQSPVQPPTQTQDTHSSTVSNTVSNTVQPPQAVHTGRTRPSPREIQEKTHKLTRAAGRGVGGFLRPFSRVGGILWLEVTGFFFGLFALFFAQDLWRTRLNYAAGPLHQRFLVAAVLTVIFAYLSASAFWRAKRK